MDTFLSLIVEAFFSFFKSLFKPLLDMFSGSSESSGQHGGLFSNVLQTTRNQMSMAADKVTGAVGKMATSVEGTFHQTTQHIHSQWDNLGSLFTNPGNVRPTSKGQQQENGFRKPDTPEEGFKIMADVLHNYQTGPRHLQTIRQIMNVYAGPGKRYGGSTEDNLIDTYVENVAKWTGFNADEPLNLSNSDVLAKVMKAMTRMEKGSKVASYYSDDSIVWAANAAINPQSAGTAPNSGLLVASAQSGSVPLPTPLNPNKLQLNISHSG